MKTLPFLLGTSIIFWGWQVQILFLASIMAIVVEGSSMILSKLTFSHSDIHRISDISAIVFLIMSIYFFILKGSTHTIFTMLQWMPVIFFPLLITQIYSTKKKMKIDALFWMLRNKNSEEKSKSIDLAYPYFVVCILSASIANIRTGGFYAGLLCLSGWALFSVRSKRYSVLTWSILLIVAGFSGHAGHIGLNNLQAELEKKVLNFYSDHMSNRIDPHKSVTAIGKIGTLKLSDRILFRVNTDKKNSRSIYLSEAYYNMFNSFMWFAIDSDFKEVNPKADKTTWILKPFKEKGRSIQISSYLEDGKGMLKLPSGSFKITNLPVKVLEKNKLGAYRVHAGPEFVMYEVHHDPDLQLKKPPNNMDLAVPEKNKPVLTKIVNTLELSSKSCPNIVNSISDFFMNNFNYSLILNNKNLSDPLENFLISSRSGHCEYFATATVLLLRSAGIPARYVTGYLAHRFSRFDKQLIVREKDAHAWVTYFINGTWHNFDTTPSSWLGFDEKKLSIWRSFCDMLSYCKFSFSKWRWNNKNNKDVTDRILLVFVPLILFAVWKLYSKNKIKRLQKQQNKKTKSILRQGTDSKFYLIEKRLIKLGYTRYYWEPLICWIKRIENRIEKKKLGGEKTASVSTASLQNILAAHYKYRFDPKSITTDEKKQLNSKVSSWLKQHNKKAPWLKSPTTPAGRG